MGRGISFRRALATGSTSENTEAAAIEATDFDDIFSTIALGVRARRISAARDIRAARLAAVR